MPTRFFNGETRARSTPRWQSSAAAIPECRLKWCSTRASEKSSPSASQAITWTRQHTAQWNMHALTSRWKCWSSWGMRVAAPSVPRVCRWRRLTSNQKAFAGYSWISKGAWTRPSGCTCTARPRAARRWWTTLQCRYSCKLMYFLTHCLCSVRWYEMITLCVCTACVSIVSPNVYFSLFDHLYSLI